MRLISKIKAYFIINSARSAKRNIKINPKKQKLLFPLKMFFKYALQFVNYLPSKIFYYNRIFKDFIAHL